jgi:hypothetical protein
VNSEQEKIVKLLMERSMGAPFIFAPDKYRKGNAVREPADLAWACNGCVLLFFMQATSNASSKAIQHNLAQAKGWMRVWRNGQPLTGKNPARDFSVDYRDVPHVVIVSVIDTADAGLRYHADEAHALGVSRCATISQTALHMLANRSASMRDVIHVIESVRESGDLGPERAIPLIADYEELSQAAALPALRGEHPARMAGAIKLASQVIAGRKITTDRYGASAWTCAEVFNDLSLSEHLQIVYTSSVLMQRVRDEGSQNNSAKLMIGLSFQLLNVIIRAVSDPVVGMAMSQDPKFRMHEPVDFTAGGSAGRFDLLLVGNPAASGGVAATMPFEIVSFFHGRRGASRTQILLTVN